MDGSESYTELLSRFVVPGSTRFDETSYGINDGAGCSGVGFAGNETSYGIGDGAGGGGVELDGSDCYFDDGGSSSSGSGLSSDSSDPEEEDDCEELEAGDAAVDLSQDEQAQVSAGGQYATACEELAQEMRDPPPRRMFEPKENCLYIKRAAILVTKQTPMLALGSTATACQAKEMLTRGVWSPEFSQQWFQVGDFEDDEGEVQVADIMVGGCFAIGVVDVQLDDGDSSSGADFQAVDHGEDEVLGDRCLYGYGPVRNLAVRRVCNLAVCRDCARRVY